MKKLFYLLIPFILSAFLLGCSTSAQVTKTDNKDWSVVEVDSSYAIETPTTEGGGTYYDEYSNFYNGYDEVININITYYPSYSYLIYPFDYWSYWYYKPYYYSYYPYYYYYPYSYYYPYYWNYSYYWSHRWNYWGHHYGPRHNWHHGLSNNYRYMNRSNIGHSNPVKQNNRVENKVVPKKQEPKYTRTQTYTSPEYRRAKSNNEYQKQTRVSPNQNQYNRTTTQPTRTTPQYNRNTTTPNRTTPQYNRTTTPAPTQYNRNTTQPTRTTPQYNRTTTPAPTQYNRNTTQPTRTTPQYNRNTTQPTRTNSYSSPSRSNGSFSSPSRSNGSFSSPSRSGGGRK